MKNVMILAVVLAMAGNAGAAGFRLAEQDAKATGMGNSFVAVADNASAAWYNPAAITGLEGTNLSLGTVMVAPSMEHVNTAANGGTTDKIKSVVHVPPHFYATRKINDKWSMGLSVNAPFGLSTEWSNATAFTKTVATKSEIKALYTNLNGAYKVNEKLSVAAGASYVMLDATMNKNIFGTKQQTLEGDGTALGYNAAAMYKMNKWQFGANYRSRVKIDVTGTMVVPGAINDNTANTTITLPDMFQMGAAYKYSEKWLFSAEADYTNWTTYDKLVIGYTTLGGTALTSTDYKNWQSVWAFRAGTEYKYSDAWKFRAGAFYDMNPVKTANFETRVPDSDRIALSVGTGYTKGNITVDASYMYLMFTERTINGDSKGSGTTILTALNGKYNSAAHLPAITVSYKF